MSCKCTSPHGAKPVLCEVGSTEGKREAVRGNVIKKSSAKTAKVMELGENT